MEKYGLKKVLELSAIAVCALSLSACVSNPNQLGFGLAGSALGGLGGSQIGKGKANLLRLVWVRYWVLLAVPSLVIVWIKLEEPRSDRA